MVLRRFFKKKGVLYWCRLNARLKFSYFVINEFTTITIFKFHSQSLLFVDFSKKINSQSQTLVTKNVIVVFVLFRKIKKII